MNDKANAGEAKEEKFDLAKIPLSMKVAITIANDRRNPLDRPIDIAERLVNSIDPNDIKRWFQLLVGRGEEAMREDMLGVPTPVETLREGDPVECIATFKTSSFASFDSFSSGNTYYISSIGTDSVDIISREKDFCFSLNSQHKHYVWNYFKRPSTKSAQEPSAVSPDNDFAIEADDFYVETLEDSRGRNEHHSVSCCKRFESPGDANKWIREVVRRCSSATPQTQITEDRVREVVESAYFNEQIELLGKHPKNHHLRKSIQNFLIKRLTTSSKPTPITRETK